MIIYLQTKSNCYSHLSEVSRRLHLKSSCYSHLSKRGRKTLNLSPASPKKTIPVFSQAGRLQLHAPLFRELIPQISDGGEVTPCFLWLAATCDFTSLCTVVLLGSICAACLDSGLLHAYMAVVWVLRWVSIAGMFGIFVC